VAGYGTASAIARCHDPATSFRFAQEKLNTNPGAFGIDDFRRNDGFKYFVASDPAGYAGLEGDWPGIERGARSTLVGRRDGYAQRGVTSGLAVAVSAQGRHAEAEALIEATPLDCDLCVDARAVIAARAGDWQSAEHWIGELERRTPHIPFAAADHGKLLLDRGDVDGAIAEFEKAHRLGPNFADPLEFWGEALMKQGDHAGAAAKFAEAARRAPRWGKNRLRWGEALMLSGRYAEARRQFAVANGLDLSKPDRAALDVLLVRTARGPLHG
jgi:tetratricopeptide (TPR) repeat protein